MRTESAKARLLEVLDEIEVYRLCGPSDDPDEQTAVVYGFRHLLTRLKRSGRILADAETKADLEAIPIPDDIYEVYDSRAAVYALIGDIRDDMEQEAASGEDSVIEPSETGLIAFISYSTVDKVIAGQVKQFLAGHNVEAFLAHEDIDVSQEWKDRITLELKRANIFIPILSKSFKASDWASQEIGFAYARGTTLIIPISIDGTIPFGFISHIQSKPIPAGGVTHDLLIEPVVRRFPRLMLPLLIKRLAGASDFRGAERLMRPLVPHFSVFNTDEINAFAFASADNAQIWDAGDCRSEMLPAFLNMHRDKMKPKLATQLEYQVTNHMWYREPTETDVAG